MLLIIIAIIMHLLRDYLAAIIINQNKVIFQMITITFEKVVVAIVVIVEMVKAKNHMMVVVIVVTTIK